MERLQGPGGVGTLNREVVTPGPAQDGLNKLFASHLPNVAPRSSFESMQSNNSSTGIENMGGKIEGWMRKMANRAKESVLQPPGGSSSSSRGEAGDLIELMEGFEGAELQEEIRGRRSGETRSQHPTAAAAAAVVGISGEHDDHDQDQEEERILSERFPPSREGRVFVSPTGS